MTTCLVIFNNFYRILNVHSSWTNVYQGSTFADLINKFGFFTVSFGPCRAFFPPSTSHSYIHKKFYSKFYCLLYNYCEVYFCSASIRTFLLNDFHRIHTHIFLMFWQNVYYVALDNSMFLWSWRLHFEAFAQKDKGTFVCLILLLRVCMLNCGISVFLKLIFYKEFSGYLKRQNTDKENTLRWGRIKNKGWI